MVAAFLKGIWGKAILALGLVLSIMAGWLVVRGQAVQEGVNQERLRQREQRGRNRQTRERIAGEVADLPDTAVQERLRPWLRDGETDDEPSDR